MNSDPNQAAREWWRQQENKDEPEEQGRQEGQDSQATRQYPVNRNYQDPQATQRQPGGQGSQDPQATQRGPGGSGGSGGSGYQDSGATRQYPLERERPADQGQPAGQQYQADPRYAGGQGTTADPRYGGGQGFAAGSGSPATPTFTPNPGTADEAPPAQGARADSGFSAGQGYPSGQPFPSGQGFPAGAGYQATGAAYQASGSGYQQDQQYPAAQGYQGPRAPQDRPASQDYPPSQGFPAAAQGYQPPPGYQAAQGYQAGATPRRRRRRRWPWITLIVIIVLLIAADRAANAFAEDQMASQFQSSLELSGKPHVTIQGFPFLTQLAAQNLHQVDINASNETAGPGGQLQIASLTATLHGMHIHGTNSATIDDFTASALVTFTALAHAGNIPGGITLSADGPNRVKAHVDLDVISGDVVLQVTQVGDNKINVKLVDANGLPTDLLGSLVNFTVTIPKLPAGVKIQTISVTPQGLRVSAAGHNATFSQ